MIKEQIVTENYAWYNSDCMYVLPTLPDASIDLAIYSPHLPGCIIIAAMKTTLVTVKVKNNF